MIQTRWLQGGLGDEAYQDMLKKTEAVLPLRRVAMPEDVAEVLVWFLEGAALVTGETLIVDSGTHLGRIPSFFKSETE